MRHFRSIEPVSKCMRLKTFREITLCSLSMENGKAVAATMGNWVVQLQGSSYISLQLYIYLWAKENCSGFLNGTVT